MLQAKLAEGPDKVASNTTVRRFKATRFETRRLTPKPIVGKVV